MIRDLTPADFRPMPWANGKGVTIELARADGPGGMLWRLSRASVAENGPFSIFPGIERNLTILTGPGFDLIGDGIAPRPPLCPGSPFRRCASLPPASPPRRMIST